MSDTMQKEYDAETIRKYEAEYVLTPWTAQKGLNPFVAAKAKGCWVYNKEGRKYLDMTSQFVFTNLGHCDDRVNAAIAKQAYKEGRAIRDVAARETQLTPEQLRTLLDPLELTKGGIKG